MFSPIVTSVILLAGMIVPKALLAQHDVATNEGFIGTWTGDNGYFRKNNVFSKPVWVHDVVKIVVSADPKGGLTMNHTYGVKGKKDYKEIRRHVVLDPATGHVYMHWGNDPENVFHATGLTEFAANRGGTFRIEGPLSRFPQKYTYKGVFELAGDIWNYHWDNSADGVTCKPSRTFEPHRAQP